MTHYIHELAMQIHVVHISKPLITLMATLHIVGIGAHATYIYIYMVCIYVCIYICGNLSDVDMVEIAWPDLCCELQ